MEHDRDVHQPEREEGAAEEPSLGPDLTAAFFAALDESDPRAVRPPIEHRLEALLDLSSAFDRFDRPASVPDAPPVETAAAAAAPAELTPAPAPQPIALLPPHLEIPDIVLHVSESASIAEPATIAETAIIEPPTSVATMEAVVERVEASAPVDESAADAPLDLEEFIVFSLADTRCVVPIRNVVEVGRIPEAAPVPHAPAWLHGLGNLRGQVLSLIDLRAFLGLGRIRPSSGRMIVLRADADEVIAGLMVDQVHQIVQLSPSRFQAAPSTLAPGYGGFVWGVCEYGLHTMVGLDVDSLLGAEALHGESVLPV